MIVLDAGSAEIAIGILYLSSSLFLTSPKDSLLKTSSFVCRLAMKFFALDSFSTV